uniref:Uncharacterized protein n=1 Tax=viral metagenome TaxID=1070528 RepID=A0A6M3KZR8_9ZZZZ
MVTEQVATPTLDAVLNGEGLGSTDVEEVSEETTPEEAEETKGVEEPEKVSDFEAKIQAEVDKRANTYREKREADTALIRSLQSQVKELRSDGSVKTGNRRIEAILSGDEDAGFTPEETQSREKALKEFNELYKDYKEQSAEVAETAKVIGDMAGKLPKDIVREFGLDDANPSLRASNGVKFLDETASVYKYNQNFLMALENFLPKGDELRTQLEDITEGLAEFNDKKSKELYLKDRLRGVKVQRKKVPMPSDGSGGEDLSKLTARQLMARGFKGKV